MTNNINAFIKARFRKTNFDAFLFFLFFAIVVWFFVQFSKTYIEIVQIPVDYTNVPADIIITEENPDVLKLRMENTGFKIAWFSLFPPTLEIDISEMEEIGGVIPYKVEEQKRSIQEQLDIDLDKSYFLNEIFTIQFEQRKVKKVAVVPKTEISFAPGYAAADSLIIQPDSVKITGPENILDTLSKVPTVQLTLNDIKQNASGEVAIDTSSLQQVRFYEKTVKYSLNVEKFTEGSVSVPVELINVPDGLNVVIFPKDVLLFYQVNLKDFHSITAADFRIICDFSNVQENQNFLIPKIVEKPDPVTNVRLNENKIQFIIKK